MHVNHHQQQFTMTPEEMAAFCGRLKTVPKLKNHHNANMQFRPTYNQCYRIDLVQTSGFDVVLGHIGVFPNYTTTTNQNAIGAIFDQEGRVSVTQMSGEKIMSNGGEVYVQPKMIQLFADTTHYDGSPVSIDRTGLSKTRATTPMTAITFEHCGQHIADSANRGDFDDLSQLSANTILGRIPEGSIGTSICSISVVSDDDDTENNQISRIITTSQGINELRDIEDIDASNDRSGDDRNTFDEIAASYIDCLMI